MCHIRFVSHSGTGTVGFMGYPYQPMEFLIHFITEGQSKHIQGSRVPGQSSRVATMQQQSLLKCGRGHTMPETSCAEKPTNPFVLRETWQQVGDLAAACSDTAWKGALMPQTHRCSECSACCRMIASETQAFHSFNQSDRIFLLVLHLRSLKAFCCRMSFRSTRRVSLILVARCMWPFLQ